MDGKNGVWRTINGAKVFIEDGQTVDEAIAAKKKAGSLLNANLDRPKKKLTERHKAALGHVKSQKTPPEITPFEYMGGTMDPSGRPIDMRKFEEGYLVSCGNDSDPANREFLLSAEGEDFLERFLSYSDDGELYVGSWFENGKNNNEPTIWIKDKATALSLAKKLGQWSITDCAAYNRFGCRNYEPLSPEQFAASNEIFLDAIEDGSQHKVRLKEVDI